VRRREFITLLGSATIWPRPVRGQSAGMLRVGMVAAQPKSYPTYQAFLQRLAELGYHEGSNLAFEFIQATNTEEFARGNRELVTRGVDILMAVGTEIALKTAPEATSAVPIVMLAIDYDPIALGLRHKPGATASQPHWHLFATD
jgi:putative tryptophan/tyrosine transport system substrate-binding protein